MSSLTVLRSAFLLLLALACSSGCHSAANAMWGALGYEKRDLLVSDVKKARDAQNDAKEDFKTTLQRFKDVTGFQGGDLEAKYNKLKSAYDDASSRADKVHSRIGNVETTAGQMFSEWEKELGEYSDPALKAKSQQQLSDTRQRYNQLLGLMKQVEARMQPVLAAFKDKVLSFKHSLDAAAIASLQGQAAQIDADVSKLISDMEASINEANQFINSMDQK